jgi:hypothetical protein
MLKLPDNDVKILIDADVLIHLYAGGVLNLLPDIYPNRIVLIENVRNEITSLKRAIEAPDGILDGKGVTEITIDDCSGQAQLEYTKLSKEKGLGDGESAVLAVARFDGKYIASSNIKDIHDYCYAYKIKYVTTMDLFLEAIEKGVLTEEECNICISTIKTKNHRLPEENTIAEYKLRV